MLVNNSKARLISYKLVQFLKTYINLQEKEISIIICLFPIQKSLGWLGYEYKDILKDVLIHKHEQSNVVKYYKNFLTIMKAFKPYIVQFEENGAIKVKIY